MNKYLFTSESVTEGHPDKVCDQISDSILDAIIEQDPYGRVGVWNFLHISSVYTDKVTIKKPVFVIKTEYELNQYFINLGQFEFYYTINN